MLKNLKIGKKLIISFILVAVLASVSGVVSMFVIQNTNTNYSDALVNYGFSQGDIGKAMLMVAENNRCVRDIVGFTDQEDINNARTKLEENIQKYATYSETVADTLTSEQELALYDKITAATEAYKIKRDEVLKLGNTTDPEQSRQAQKMAVRELDPLYDDLYKSWAELMDMNVTTGTDLSTDLNRQGNLSLILNLVITIAALAISVILGIYISRGIANPIKSCVNRLVQLEQGDLSTPVPESTSQDETGILLGALKNTTDGLQTIIGDAGYLLGEMAQGNFNIRTQFEEKYVGDFSKLLASMRRLNQDMSHALSQIDQSADQVASGSDQVSSGAQALSQGATEQASSVEELAATINDISIQVQSNAENAKQASDKASSVGNEMAESNQKMQEMIVAMNDISNSSKEIGKIIKTIEDIAFQTNILALNAAVEAARAGAAGKGFAVVADEVRNLASKSAEASKNTATLIESSIQAVENGTQIADATAQSLVTAVAGAEEVSNTIDKIAKASDEQFVSISQVTQGVDQISSVIQTNSATAEESAAASEELSGQAQMLKNLVGQFKLKNHSDRTFNNDTPQPSPQMEQPTLAMDAGKY